MSWKYILKSEEEGRDELLEKLVNNVHFFWNGARKDSIVGPLEGYFADELKPLVRSLEFMRPIKDDLEIVERGNRILFTYYFKLFGVRCGIQYRHHKLGNISKDNYIIVGSTEVCVKPTGVMTNGDFLTTLVLAIKNNAVPNILKFVAYAKSTGFKAYGGTTVFNTQEEAFKMVYIEHLIESGKLMGDINDMYNFINQGSLSDFDLFLLTKGVPKEVLGSW